jgi:hypothetical protein
MPIVKQTDPPPYCNEELTVAIWAFFERNFQILNEVSQNIYSFIMCVPFLSNFRAVAIS